MKTLPLTFVLITVGVLVSLNLRGADEPAVTPVILLTGFEPFQTVKVNPSWETVKLFQGKEIGGYRVETVLLPVVYDEMEKPLLDAVKKHKPAIVISFGVADNDFRVETVALNGYHPQRPPDNKAKRPTRKQIVPDGAAEIKTTLPAEAIVKALEELKIGVKISKDAGGYLCNECFYRLMKECESVPVRGFIHVPNYETTDPVGNKVDQALLTKGVETVIGAVVKAQVKR